MVLQHKGLAVTSLADIRSGEDRQWTSVANSGRPLTVSYEIDLTVPNAHPPSMACEVFAGRLSAT